MKTDLARPCCSARQFTEDNPTGLGGRRKTSGLAKKELAERDEGLVTLSDGGPTGRCSDWPRWRAFGVASLLLSPPRLTLGLSPADTS